MARTITRFFHWHTLKTRGKSTTTVVKLMMACNDLSYANQALGRCRATSNPRLAQYGAGAALYFVRIQLGHLFEAFKVIASIEADPRLLSVVNSCDTQTQECFAELRQFVNGAPKRQEILNLAGKIRHNLAFHYDESGDLISRAISDRARRPEADVSSLTRGDSMELWDFRPANEIVDSIVVRQIWKIPRTADLRSEADKAAARVHQIMLWFVDFAGEFVWRYCVE
jgi:hypothetical protein